MDRLCYTYYTGKGANYLSGFHTTESFLQIAKRSVEQARKFFPEVLIYTDEEGKLFLQQEGFDVDFCIVDYDSYEWNKGFWSFPKLITYNLQDRPFLHIDMDVILESKPTNSDCPLICEKVRPLVMFSSRRKWLPPVVQANYSPNNICSGILGGNPEIFKKLFSVSSQLVKNRDNHISFDMVMGIEEIVLTAICKLNGISPQAIDCVFTHYQSSAEKMRLTYDIKSEELIL